LTGRLQQNFAYVYSINLKGGGLWAKTATTASSIAANNETTLRWAGGYWFSALKKWAVASGLAGRGQVIFEFGLEQPASLSNGLAFLNVAGRVAALPDWDDDFKLEG